MHGLHLTADLYGCRGPRPLLLSAAALAALCRAQADAAGLVCVGETWFGFPERAGQPGGVTGTLLLAESHLAIHTWPELAQVTLDVYVCNVSGDNSAKAERLLRGIVDALAPQREQVHRLRRGLPAAAAGGLAP